jgi:hypothetical protein
MMPRNKYENFDPNDPACLPQFIEMAEEYSRRHLVDRESALRELVRIGIATADGRLTKEYGGS